MMNLGDARGLPDPFEAVDYDEAPPAVKEYLKPSSMMARFDPVRFDPSYQQAGDKFDRWAEGKGWGEIAKLEGAPDVPVMDEPIEGPLGAISLPMARLGAKNIIRRRFSKWGSGKLMQQEARLEGKAIEALDIDDLVQRIPEGLWERIKSFRSTTRHPTTGEAYSGLHTAGQTITPRYGDPIREGAEIWVSPYAADPAGVMTHEVAHEASDAFLEWSAKQYATGSKSAFAKVRREWGEIAADMRYLEQHTMAGQAGGTGELYRFNPDEIFANRFSDALYEGLDFNEAVKFGVHEVRANLSRSREIVDETNKALNRSAGRPSMVVY